MSVVAVATVVGVVAIPGSVHAQATTRASVSSTSVEGNADSSRPAISGDNRFIAFESEATTLVADDTNGVEDVFVYDRITGETVRVSLSSSGEQGDAESGRPAISADGRFLAFYSDASNFAAGDTAIFDADSCPDCTGRRDVFVRDRDPDQNGVFDEESATTSRVSISSGGESGNDDSTRPTISDDGRYIAFNSDATNLITSDTNAARDVFVHDSQTSATIRASESADGEGGSAKSDRPAISGDGRFLAFYSDATNLIAEDTNALRDVYVKNLVDQTVIRVGQPTAGGESDGLNTRPSISADGRFVAFRSTATNLDSRDTNDAEDVYLHDRDPDENGMFDEGNAVIDLISLADVGGVAGDGNSSSPSVSGDGRFVAFHSTADNLVDGDTNLQNDVFLQDRTTGKTTRVSVCGADTDGDNDSGDAAISDGGEFVSFVSQATNLVEDDANAVDDVFLREVNFSGQPGPCGVSVGDGDGGGLGSGSGSGSGASGGACGAAGMLPLGMMLMGLLAVRFRQR